MDWGQGLTIKKRLTLEPEASAEPKVFDREKHSGDPLRFRPTLQRLVASNAQR